jgi:hypothetical protein
LLLLLPQDYEAPRLLIVGGGRLIRRLEQSCDLLIGKIIFRKHTDTAAFPDGQQGIVK